MRTLLGLFVLLGVLLGAAGAGGDEIPPLVFCRVDPWDQMEDPRVIAMPGYVEGVYDPPRESEILITLLDDNYEPLPGLYVEIIIHAQCGPATGPICICDAAELTGYTDDEGQLSLHMDFGGCCEHPEAVEIRAGGVTVRLESPIVSPDWDGDGGDCEVGLADFISFSRGFEIGAADCSDFSGDGTTSLVDFVIFGAGWGHDCAAR
ncbi:MAG: hypothetical protein GF330_14090 [Candidatus Eisenbacteria bacterium]|nr:hypothetical protein [Candidatus Eisenbacteria bacterium]